MKLTKSQLMTVINEELEQLDEFSWPWAKAVPVDFNTNWDWKDYEYEDTQKPLVSLSSKLKGKEKWEALRPSIDLMAQIMEKWGLAVAQGGDDNDREAITRVAKDLQRVSAIKTTPKDFLPNWQRTFEHVTRMVAHIDESLANQAKAAAEESAERAQRAWEAGAPERKARAHRQKEKDDWAAEVAYRDKYGSPQTRDFHRANPGTAGTANLGYGEGIERAELEKIIQEELEGMLK